MTSRILAHSFGGVLLLALGSGCVFDSTGLSAGPPGLGGPSNPDTTGSPWEPATGSTGVPTTDALGTSGTTDAPGTTGTTIDMTGTTGTTAMGSSGVVEMCGDGVVGPGEECDLGAKNSNTGACTLECKKATCGDGLVQEAVGEQCDFGLGNGEGYNGCLPDSCQWGPRCGDHVVDPQHEFCDAGELNGSGLKDGDGAPCSLTCGFAGKRIFVTSKVFNGALGGVSGGDLKCRKAAQDAELPHPNGFRAWLSDDAQSPENRFDQWPMVGVPVILIDGEIVADDLLDLVENGPRIGIRLTEHHEAVFGWPVWTNTSGAGEVYSPTQHCIGWNSADGMQIARQGRNAEADDEGPSWQTWRDQRHWTSHKSNFCALNARLYCIDDAFELEG